MMRARLLTAMSASSIRNASDLGRGRGVADDDEGVEAAGFEMRSWSSATAARTVLRSTISSAPFIGATSR